MYRSVLGLSCLLLFVIINTSTVAAQDVATAPEVNNRVVTIKPQYMSPSEIFNFLGAKNVGNYGIYEMRDGAGRHYVEIRHNDAANLLTISGVADDVDFVKKIVKEADVPPRQIEIEVKIIEVRTLKARDVGIDWDKLCNGLMAEDVV